MKVNKRNTYGSPRWSNEFLDCSMPMTFDTYSLCSYKCQYCFSYYQRIHNSDYENNFAKWVDVEKVKKIFLQPDSSQFGEYVKKRIPMQWGGLSEPFDPLDKEYGVTLQLMKFFREIDYPIAFSTKATWFTKDQRYIDVIKGAKNFHFKFSIITLDEEKARLMEQGVPTPNERLEAMQVIANLDTAGVNLRLRPFIIGVSNPTHLDLIREAKKRGAQSLTTEFFCLEARADIRLKKRYKIMSGICGYDIYRFYQKYTQGSGYWRLNYEVKRKYVEEMQTLCQELGMNFFVSDAHHKEKCSWGSCCGLPQDSYFSNYAKCQFTEALQVAKEKGEVRFSDIKENFHLFLEKVKVTGVLHSGDMARVYHKSMFDYMRWAWNNPSKCATSPFRLFDQILIPTGLDKEENVIYKFNKVKYDNHSK